MPIRRPTPLDLVVTLLASAAIAHYGWGVFSPSVGAAAALGYNVLFGVGAITCLVTASRLRAEGGVRAIRTWALLAAALACVLLAQAVMILMRAPLNEPVSDVLALLYYPFVTIGFWREVPRASSRAAQHAAMLDLALVFVAALTIMAALLVRSLDGAGWDVIPAVLYRTVSPAMALVAVAAALNWYLTSARGGRPALGLAALATVGIALGDLVLNVFPQEWNRWSNVAWAAGVWFLVIGAQRAHGDGRERGADTRTTPFSGAIPFATAAALIITLLSVLVASGRPETVLLATGGALIMVLLVARHSMALRTASALEQARADQEARLRESERLDALGRMARGVAHDFNGMLTAVLGNAELALDSAPPSGESREALERIREVALTASGITRQLLDYARSGAVEPVVIDVAAVLRAQWRILAPTLPATIAVDLHADAGPMWIRTGAGFIEQVVHNLVSNARDAMPVGGTLRLEVRGTEAVVTVVVADSGAGMDDATRQRIFEPFFSTKGSRGTGLGLATVYGIVRQGGGEIHVASAPGRGTTFTLDFPRAS